MNGLLILLVFLLSAGFTWYLCHPAARLRILDAPNPRSLHEIPVPRTGGLAVLAAAVLGSLPFSVVRVEDANFISVMAAVMLIVFVSLLDDRHGLSAMLRLLIHAVSAVLVVLLGGLVPETLELPVWQWRWPAEISLAFTALFIIWMTNLYNFMDGMDGFAGGMSLLGFSAYAVLGWQAGEPLFTMASLIIAAAAAGFLVFNFPPARIFMGDVGAAPLGFLCACLSLWAAVENIFPIWVGILVFSPFIADATVTLLSRLVAGQRIWEAHQSHYYQRLVRLGWGHRKTVLSEYALMIAAGLSANVAVVLSPRGQWILILAWCLIYLGLALLVRGMESDKMLEG
jgi:UDP-N-acetylmuramyl pentapeptide phosphotransferase/UDP-N-acetylglucosamine-1-phosphate transferase